MKITEQIHKQSHTHRHSYTYTYIHTPTVRVARDTSFEFLNVSVYLLMVISGYSCISGRMRVLPTAMYLFHILLLLRVTGVVKETHEIWTRTR
jgi:hypothetical protein